MRLDADDYLEDFFLSKMFRYIENEDTFYYGDYVTVSENGVQLSKVNLIKFNKNEIKCRGDFLATGTVYSRKMLISVGLYSEKIKNCGLENYQLILNLINRGFLGKHIKENLFFYRRHGSSLSAKKLGDIIKHGCELAEEYELSAYTINQYHPYLSTKDLDIYVVRYINYAEE